MFQESFSLPRIFSFSSFSFILGIFCASFLPAGLSAETSAQAEALAEAGDFRLIIYFSFFSASFLFFISLFLKERRGPGVIALFFFFGIIRYGLSVPAFDPEKIHYYNGRSEAIRGIISLEPDIGDESVKYVLESLSIGGEKLKGKLLISLKSYPRYRYGDELEVVCRLQAPEEINGFAYDRYLAKSGIYSLCYYPKVRIISRGQGSVFLKIIFFAKDKVRAGLSRGLEEPEAGIARAFVLGDRRTIPPDLSLAFSRAGLSHLIAISGMHITVLAAATIAVLLALGASRKKSFFIAAAVLFFYLLLVGPLASAWRSGLMGFLALAAIRLGRLSRLPRALLFSAAGLLLFNPRLLCDDIGFQLSFLAVLGIAYFYSVFSSFFEKRLATINSRPIRKFFQAAASGLAVTLAAQALTWPILAFNFSIISPISFLANLLVVWTSSPLLLGALVAVILSLFAPPLAFVFFAPVLFLFRYVVFISERIIKLPFAFLEIHFGRGALLAYYFIVFILFKKIKSHAKK